MTRLDKALVELGYCTTRAKAQDAIKEGRVQVNGVLVTKNSLMIKEEDELHVKEGGLRFASRAGYKLYDVLQPFGIKLKDRVVMDVGASTGGFSDVVLSEGARTVYALDVGSNQMDPVLLENPRLHNMENINCRYITKELFAEPVTFACIDVSFISLKLILPSVLACMEKIEVVALVKPQFEAGRADVGKHGIVKNRKVHERVLKEIHALVISLDCDIHHAVKSSVIGRDGNQEYVIHIKQEPAKQTMQFKSILL